MSVPAWAWVAFAAFVLAMLALDLFVLHRRAHEVSLKEAGLWSAVWAVIGLGFGALLWAWSWPSPLTPPWCTPPTCSRCRACGPCTSCSPGLPPCSATCSPGLAVIWPPWRSSCSSPMSTRSPRGPPRSSSPSCSPPSPSYPSRHPPLRTPSKTARARQWHAAWARAATKRKSFPARRLPQRRHGSSGQLSSG